MSHSSKERVGPITVVAEKEHGKETWQLAVIGRECLFWFTDMTEDLAKLKAVQLERGLCAVASWAARECDTETTRRELIEQMEGRIERRDGKREVFNG